MGWTVLDTYDLSDPPKMVDVGLLHCKHCQVPFEGTGPWCPECADASERWNWQGKVHCQAHNPKNGLICWRTKGHTGRHVAGCGGEPCNTTQPWSD